MKRSYLEILEQLKTISQLSEKLKFLVSRQPSNYLTWLSNEKYGYAEILKEIISFSANSLSSSCYTLKTKIYWALNNLTDFPRCQICGKSLEGQNVESVQKGYGKQLCSKKCRRDLASRQRKQTMLNHYGCTNNLARAEVLKKIRKTNLEKYGTACPANSRIIKAKIQQHNLEKFGVKNYQSTDEFREKVKKTSLEKYGVENVMKRSETLQKIKEQNLKKYGVEHVFQLKEFKDKLHQQRLQKYGENYRQILWGNKGNSGQSRRAYQQYILKSTLVTPLFTEDEYINSRKAGCNLFKFRCKKCGTEFMSDWNDGGTSKSCPKCQMTQTKTSAEEIEVYELVNSVLSRHNLEVRHNDRAFLSGKYELDVFVPAKKLAIEFDGLYWHNDDNQTDYRYHLRKTEACEKQGIQLIHIFENEWKHRSTIVKSRIKNLLGVYDKIVYARKCVITEVDSKLSKEFQEQNHIQGAVNASVNLGLFFEDQLVSLMTFSKTRFSKKYEWELVRFCSKLGYHIPGAAGKLLKHFELNWKPKSLVSYADRRWSQGKVYKALGFELDHVSAPNYWYFKSYSVVNLESRVKYQKHKLNRKLKTYDPSLSEVENMKENGYHRIFDCGNLVFVKVYNDII